MEYMLRNIPNDYSFKSEYLETNAESIEVLFLGSSHTYYGINPEYCEGIAFNASHISQTIDLDLEILKKYSTDLKELKYLVIPIDYFTFYSRISTGPEPWRMKNYNIYYDINSTLNLRNNYEVLSFSLKENYQRISAFYLNDSSSRTCSDLGYVNIIRSQMDLIETGTTAAKRHTDNNNIELLKESVKIIDYIIHYAEKNNISIIFYTSPAYITYRKNLEIEQLNLTLNTIDSISGEHKNTVYFNFLADDRFKSSDFFDADHLNNIGARKLTEIIDSIIKIQTHNNM